MVAALTLAASTFSNSGLPGTRGTWFSSASRRASCLRPKASICADVGPMKTIPAAASGSEIGIFTEQAIPGVDRFDVAFIAICGIGPLEDNSR